MDKYLPKNSKFALLKVQHSTLFFVEESDNLQELLDKQSKKELDTSKFIIDKQGKFQHSLSLNESLDIQTVKL